MNIYFVIAGVLNSSAALLHVGCIFFGTPWYRFFGAGEEMAILAEQGSLTPTLITSGITIVLLIWALYAFSAAGLIHKLPLMRLALIAITAIYIIRGAGGFFMTTPPIGAAPSFWFWSSAICLCIGTTHLLGLKQAWGDL